MVWMYAVTTAGAQPTNERGMHAHATTASFLPKHTYFDTDSYKIYIDNCASRCITNNLRDIVDTPVPSNIKI